MNLKHNLRKNVIRYARTIAVMLLTCIVTLNGVPLASALTFSDVPSSHWAYTSIDYMSENEYICLELEEDVLNRTQLSHVPK